VSRRIATHPNGVRNTLVRPCISSLHLRLSQMRRFKTFLERSAKPEQVSSNIHILHEAERPPRAKRRNVGTKKKVNYPRTGKSLGRNKVVTNEYKLRVPCVVIHIVHPSSTGLQPTDTRAVPYS
jgi:hypothetical protein